MASRWRLSSRDADRLSALTGDPLPPLRAIPAARRQALHRLGAERYADLVHLAAAEDRADDAGAALAEALAESAGWQPKTLPITGHDIMALGVPAGPAVGRVLAEVEDWWIAKDFAPATPPASRRREPCCAISGMPIRHPPALLDKGRVAPYPKAKPLGDSLTVELSALDRAVLVRIQVPQPDLVFAGSLSSAAVRR